MLSDTFFVCASLQGELMEGDNAYLCEELGTRVPAVKRTAIKALPQMLCVHLKRFEFDYHNQTRHKLRDRWAVLPPRGGKARGSGLAACLEFACAASRHRNRYALFPASHALQ
jgi:hypothetical protein